MVVPDDAHVRAQDVAWSVARGPIAVGFWGCEALNNAEARA